jgi:5-methyltetrahydrofolate--homocysteine methyltransferase
VRHLEPLLATAARRRKAKVVLATVQGDIHDIGKKIVALLLRNNGYEVIDLGKSVADEDIVAQAQVRDADVIGLSALMTTTMEEMPKVIALARAKMPRIKVMVGGAVVTPAFARTIGADGYAVDSVQAVKVLDQWFGAKTGVGKPASAVKKIKIKVKTKAAARTRRGRPGVAKAKRRP